MVLTAGFSTVFRTAWEVSPKDCPTVVEFTDKILESTNVMKDFCGLVNDRELPHNTLTRTSYTNQIMHVAAFLLFLQKYEIRCFDGPLGYLLGDNVFGNKSAGGPLKAFVAGAMFDHPWLCISAISRRAHSIRSWSPKNIPPRQGVSLNPEDMSPEIWALIPSPYQRALEKTAAQLRDRHDRSKRVDIFRVFFRHLPKAQYVEMIRYLGRFPYIKKAPSDTNDSDAEARSA